MADPMRGHGGYLGFGEQVAYDTPVALTHFILAKKLGIQRRIDREDVDNLGYPGEAPVAHDSYEKMETVEGSTVHHLGYDDNGMLLLKHCFGGGSSSGSGPYDHELVLTDNTPSGTEGLTIHQVYGSGPLANKAETFVGCVVNGFSVGCDFEQMAEWTIDWIGKTGGGPTAATAPTLTDRPSRVKHQHLSAAGLRIGGVKVDNLQKWRLNVRKNLARVDDLGSLSTQKPVPDGMYEITLDLEWEWSANSNYNGHLAGTFSSVTWTLSDGTHGMVFTLPRCQMGPVDRKVDGPGKLRCSATLRAFASIDVHALILTLTNGKATLEAA